MVRNKIDMERKDKWTKPEIKKEIIKERVVAIEGAWYCPASTCERGPIVEKGI